MAAMHRGRVNRQVIGTSPTGALGPSRGDCYNTMHLEGEARMARRKKTSPIEDVMDLVSMPPWWAGVGLALVSYLLLHAVADRKSVV